MANELPVKELAGLIDDAAFTPGTSRVIPIGAEFDDAAPDSVDEGDAGVLRMSARRELYVQLRDSAGNERGANVNTSGELTVSVDGNKADLDSDAGTDNHPVVAIGLPGAGGHVTGGTTTNPLNVALGDGKDTAEGTTTDAPFVGTEDGTGRSVISLLKGVKNTLYSSVMGILGATNGAAVVTDADGTIQQFLRGLVTLVAARLPGTLAAGGGMKVEGVAGGVAQPISAAALPLPAGAATEATLLAQGSGQYTTPTHTAPTAGVASGAILATNANRLYALFENDSDTTVYLALGADAVLNQGIRLNANGGSYEMSKKLGNLYTGAVNGISGVAGKVVLVTEGV